MKQRNNVNESEKYGTKVTDRPFGVEGRIIEYSSYDSSSMTGWVRPSYPHN